MAKLEEIDLFKTLLAKRERLARKFAALKQMAESGVARAQREIQRAGDKVVEMRNSPPVYIDNPRNRSIAGVAGLATGNIQGAVREAGDLVNSLARAQRMQNPTATVTGVLESGDED